MSSARKHALIRRANERADAAEQKLKLVEFHYETLKGLARIMADKLQVLGPDGRKPMTWDQFVAAAKAEWPEEGESDEFCKCTPEEQQEIMRVVRMVERAHMIGV